jgi:hypothetical protein
MPTPQHHTTLAAALLVLLACSLSPGAEQPRSPAPRDELLRFVPEDAAFCLVVQDLRGQFARLAGSPFARYWPKSALGQSLAASAQWKQLLQVEQHLKKHLAIGWAELRDDLLGDAFAFAYRPGPPGKPDLEQGLFLLRARNEKTLADLVRKFNQLQKASGELKSLDEREHKGVKYFRRVENNQNSYYLLRGPVLLFTKQEAGLRLAIEKDQALPRGAVPVLSRRMHDLGLDSALAALTIQPRAFDAHIAGKGNTEQANRTLTRCWRALEGIGLGLHLKRDLELTLAVKARTEQLPPSARRLLAVSARGSDLLASFPEDALLASAGRLDLSALYEFVGEFLPGPAREVLTGELERTLGAMLGKSLIKEVLPAVGPDVGFCLTAPAAGTKGWAPGFVAAMRIARGDEDDPIDQALFSTVESWAQLAVLGHNKQNPGQPLRLRTTYIDRARVRYLQGEGVFPAGAEPAFGLRRGYLVLASSLPEFRRFKGSAPTPASTAVPLLRISFKAWKSYLKDRREPLAAALATREKLTREKAREKIDSLRGSLELFERMELRHQASSGRVTFTLTVQTTQALRKP